MATLFKNNRIEVYENGSGEIFVRSIHGAGHGIVLRISDNDQGFVVTAQGSRISPTAVNGLDAFRITN